MGRGGARRAGMLGFVYVTTMVSGAAADQGRHVSDGLHEGFLGLSHSEGTHSGTGVALGLGASIIAAVAPDPGWSDWALGDLVEIDVGLGTHSNPVVAPWGHLAFAAGIQGVYAPSTRREIVVRLGRRWVSDNAFDLEREAYWFAESSVRLDALVLEAGLGPDLIMGGVGFRVGRLKYGVSIESLAGRGTRVVAGVWVNP